MSDEQQSEGQQAEATSKRGRVSRVARRTTLQIAVVAALLLAATQTSFFRDAVREQLVPTINESLAGRLKIGGLEGSLLGGLELEDVEVFDARGNLVARVERATADYSLIDLANRRLSLDTIEASGGLVIVRYYPDGELNLGLIAKPSDEPAAEGPSALSIHIGALTLSDAHVLYADARPAAEGAEAPPEGLDALVARLDGEPEGEPSEFSAAWAADASALSESALVGAPRAAALRDVGATLDVTIERSGDIEAAVKSVTAVARANTMVGEVGLEASGLEVGLYEDAIMASSEGLSVAGQSVWEGLSAGLVYGAEEADGERPIETLYLTADRLALTRAQLDAAAPGTGVKAGFDGVLSVGGDVGDVRVSLAGRFEGGAGEVLAGARLKGVVESMLATDGAKGGGGAPSYEMSASVRGLEVSSIYDVGADVVLNADMGVRGSGLEVESLDVSGELRVHDARADRVELELLEVALGFSGGKARIERAVLRTPYADAEASGWATLGGEVDVSLSARTEARHAREVYVGGEGEEPIAVPQNANLEIAIKGAFDLERTDDPVVMTRELDVKGGWSIEGFEGGGVEIARSTGKVDVEVDTPEEGARAWRYDLEARIARLRAPDAKADGLVVDVDGETRVTAPLTNPLKLLKKLRSDTSVSADRFEGFGVTLNNATLDAVTRPGGLGLEYDVDASVGSTSVNTGGTRARVSSASVDVSGGVSLDFGASSAARALRAVGVKGELEAKGVVASGLASVSGVKATLDVKGALDDLHGSAELDASSGEVSGVAFEEVDASASITSARAFDWDVLVSRPEDELPGRVMLKGRGKLPSTLDGVTVDDMLLRVDQGGVWRVEKAVVDASEPGVVRFDDVTLKSGPQEVRVDGVYRARGAQDLTASLKSVELARVRKDFGLEGLIAPMKGRVPELTLTMKGTAREPEVTLSGGMEGVSYDGLGPFTLNTRASYRRDRFTLTTFDLDGLGQEHLVDAQVMIPMRVDLSGGYEVFWQKSLLATVTVHPIDLRKVDGALEAVDVSGLDGTVSGMLVASGTLEEPTLDSTFHGYDVAVKRTFGEQTVDIVDLGFDVKLDYQPPRGKEGGLDTKAKVRWEGAQKMSLELKTPLPFAAWIYDVVEKGEEIDWAAQTLSQPYDLDFKVEGMDLRRVDVRPLLSAPDAAGVLDMSVVGKGKFDDPVLDFDVTVGGMTGGEAFDCAGMEGEEWKAPRRRVGESVGGFGWGRFRDILMRLEGNVRGGKLTLECAKVNWDKDDIVTAVGVVPLPMNVLYEGGTLEDLPIDFDLVLHGNELNKLSAVDYDAFSTLVGTIRGELEAKGSLKQPMFEGVLEVVDTTLGQGQVGTVHVEVGAAKEVARTRGWVKVGRGESGVEVAGFGALARLNLDMMALAKGGSPLAVKSRGKRGIEGGGRTATLMPEDDVRVVMATMGDEPVRLEQIFPSTYFSKIVKGLKGGVKVDVDVSGTYAKLVPRGEVSFSEVEATVLSLGRRFEDIGAKIVLDEEALALEELKVSEGTSELEMTARLEHESSRPGKMTAQMKTKSFDLGSFADFPAFVTGVVDVKGEMGERPPRMAVDITELDVRLPDDLGGDLHPTELDEDIVIVRRSADELALQTVEGVDVDVFAGEKQKGAGFDIDMAISFERGSLLYHPYGYVAFHGDLDVERKRGVTRVVGTVVGERGDVEFLDKRFKLNDAVVTFTGPATTPQLQIDAVYFIDRSVAEQLSEPRDGKARVVIRIDGTPSDPKLKLISDPSLTDTEILYILATGRPPSTAEVGQDQGVVSAALGAASGLALAMLQDSLSIKIPVDVLRLEGGTGDQAIGGFEVGKYLTPDLFVSYRQRFSSSDQASESILGIEFQFAPKWKFETTLSTNSAASFNVFRELR